MSVDRVRYWVLALFLAFGALAPMSAEARYSALVVDAATGRDLISEDADEVRHPASLAKLMTLYLVFEALQNGQLRLQQSLPVSREAANQAPSKLDLRAGSTITVEDAIYGVITKSANDAAVVLAEAIGRDERDFADLMTDRARSLGMRQTYFRNASGLPDPAQTTTARDMVRLGMALLRDHPKYYPYFSARTFTFRGQVFTTHNRLLDSLAGTDGMKTGFIQASGFNVVTSVERSGRRLVGVMFGGDSALARDRHVESLFDEAFEIARTRSAMRTNITYVPTRFDRKATPVRYQVASGPTPAANPTPRREAASTTIPAPRQTRKAPQKNESRWAIQVGAYNAADLAHAQIGKVTKIASNHVNGAEPSVDTVKNRGKVLYRARLNGLSESNAQAACRSLERQRIGCMAINLENARG